MSSNRLIITWEMYMFDVQISCFSAQRGIRWQILFLWLPEYQCPPGHACPVGSAEPTICSPGTFQPLSGQSTCNTCPPGNQKIWDRLWIKKAGVLKLITPSCPGFYCMEGSSVPDPCPIGSVGPSAGMTSLSDCSPCPSGFFCNRSALMEPTGPCSQGLTVLHHHRE